MERRTLSRTRPSLMNGKGTSKREKDELGGVERTFGHWCCLEGGRLTFLGEFLCAIDEE